ncbi:hypothetical protein [Calycomorphotria hydatis]|uniref:Carboxypeptidase regulatory-like domain-containing protein n=1 Tax=Calycomorphotria hydatis TaxID=2528027 RepID=A0A517T8J6_9PLAN|nr:hypothetical protein [Calycomorphotria hydatis]QDT64679.1 hypothetical protein V22_19200 [Calycomorphotria hydatis]
MFNRVPSVAILIVVLVGCGGSNGPDIYIVSGTVTFKGSPVKSGDIRFMPDTSKGREGPTGLATIENGYFKTRDGRGVIAGPYVALVRGHSDQADEEGTPLPLFPDYRMELDFPSEDSSIEITVPSVSE